MYTPKIDHAWVSITNSLRPTTAVPFLLPTETDALRTVLHGSAAAGRPKPGQPGPYTSSRGHPCALVIMWAPGSARACNSSQNHRSQPSPGVTPQKRPEGQENYKGGGAPFFTHVPSWQNRFWGGGLPQFGAGDLSPVVPLSGEYNYLS